MFKTGDRVRILPYTQEMGFDVIGTITGDIQNDPKYDYDVFIDGLSDSPLGDLTQELFKTKSIPFHVTELEQVESRYFICSCGLDCGLVWRLTCNSIHVNCSYDDKGWGPSAYSSVAHFNAQVRDGKLVEVPASEINL